LRDARYDPAKPTAAFVNDVCASFQAAVVDVLLKKLFRAAEVYGVRDVAIAGGVSANSSLRSRAEAGAVRRGLRLFTPRMEYCTDNGAMVAMTGYLRLRDGRRSSLEMSAEPNLAFARR
jgi:N6-L-threonylcarbamoyladenine synthase